MYHAHSNARGIYRTADGRHTSAPHPSHGASQLLSAACIEVQVATPSTKRCAGARRAAELRSAVDTVLLWRCTGTRYGAQEGILGKHPGAEPVAQSELCGTARVGEAGAWVQQGLRNALSASADEQKGTYGPRKACWDASRILYKCVLRDLSRPGQQI